MHEKNIKRIVAKQLKKRFPHWNRLTRKQKKAISKETLDKVMKEYSFNKEVEVPLNELTGTPEMPEGIMSLSDMERFISDNNKNIFKLPNLSRKKYIKDNELTAIDELKVKINHSQLSQFRSSLTFRQMVNIMVYIIHLFLKTGKINNSGSIYSIDSSELPAVCNPKPLATIEIGDKKVRILQTLKLTVGRGERRGTNQSIL